MADRQAVPAPPAFPLAGGSQMSQTMTDGLKKPWGPGISSTSLPRYEEELLRRSINQEVDL